MKLIALLIFGILITGCSSAERGPAFDGLSLGSCPDSPNCVISYPTADEKHYIEPIPYDFTREEAVVRLISIVSDMDRSEIVTARQDYIHVIFKSSFFKFIDDVEFYLPENEKVIHIRSAARKGYSDFGVNRKRIETIRREFQD